MSELLVLTFSHSMTNQEADELTGRLRARGIEALIIDGGCTGSNVLHGEMPDAVEPLTSTMGGEEVYAWIERNRIDQQYFWARESPGPQWRKVYVQV